MQDESTLPRNHQIRAVKDPSDDLVELCKEYFEIAIGHRKPTDSEESEANKRVLNGLFSEEQDVEDKVKIMKYPLSVGVEALIRRFYQLEYDVFDFLAKNTGLIDGPFIPMLRYELSMQKQLRNEEKYDTAIMRQSSFLETYFKIKMGKWKDSNGTYLSWELCLDSAYRGEDLITEQEIEKLRGLAQTRNRFAHDWRALADRPTPEMTTIKESFTAGLETISALYGRELKQVYEDYSSEHISDCYPSQWSNRAKSELKPNAAVIKTQISCDNCGEEFYPGDDGWKRCPECDSSHDWLDTVT